MVWLVKGEGVAINFLAALRKNFLGRKNAVRSATGEFRSATSKVLIASVKSCAAAVRSAGGGSFGRRRSTGAKKLKASPSPYQSQPSRQSERTTPISEMINAATQIIKDCLIDGHLLEWTSCDAESQQVEQYDSMELLDMMEQFAFDNPECYDEDWYPIIEVKAIKATVDWLYLAEYASDERVNQRIESIFED